MAEAGTENGDPTTGSDPSTPTAGETGRDALRYLARRRRQHRVGDLEVSEVLYTIEIIGIPTAAFVFLGYWAQSSHVQRVPVPGWLQWAAGGVLLLYAVLRLVSAAGLGPVRLEAAEAQLLVSAPLSPRRFLTPKILAAVGREATGAAAVSLGFAVEVAVVFGAPFWQTWAAALAGLVPYAAAVAAAAWLVENSPRVQRGIKAALPRLAWLPAVAVVAAPFVVHRLASVEVTSPAGRWWGPWAWATDPAVSSASGAPPQWSGALGVAILAAALLAVGLWRAGRPAVEQISARSRLLAQAKALRFFQDTVGLHAVRRQLWARPGARRSGRPPRPGVAALLWKSVRHVQREGTGAWGLPLACALATTIAAGVGPPALGIGLGVVLLYVPASRLLAPMLADVEAATFTTQLPYPARVRVLCSLFGPALLLVASALASAAIVALAGIVPPDKALLAAGLAPVAMLFALACAAFGVVPRDLDAMFLLPQELQFMARYPGQLAWLAGLAAAIAAGLHWRTIGSVAAVLAAATAVVAWLLTRSYTKAVAPAEMAVPPVWGN